MDEELCEIVCSCNANDIELLRVIKQYMEKGRRILNEAGKNEEGVEVYDWAFLVRALLKMQSKGVVQLEFVSSLGIISPNNIDRFHITIFGQNLLEHITVDY